MNLIGECFVKSFMKSRQFREQKMDRMFGMIQFCFPHYRADPYAIGYKFII